MAMGNPWLTLGAALLGGLFGRKQEYDPSQQMMMQIANQQRNFANSVPLSDPSEQAALAEQRGMLGGEQRQDLGTLMASMPNYATTGAGGQGDMMKNMLSAQTGQRMALSSQALMSALASRRRALMEAAQVAQGVGPRQQRPGIGGDLANLMRMYSQYQAQQQGGGGGGGISGGQGGVFPNFGIGGQAKGGAIPAAPGGMPWAQPPGGGTMADMTPDTSWRAQIPNFLNGMGNWGQQPPAGAGFGIPTGNGTADQFMGGGMGAMMRGSSMPGQMTDYLSMLRQFQGQ